MAKQNLTENFAGKICPKTSSFTIGRIDIHKGLNTEGIKDHKNRPGLPEKTKGKEKPGNLNLKLKLYFGPFSQKYIQCIAQFMSIIFNDRTLNVSVLIIQ